MQPANDRVKIQVLVVPINSNQPINESQSPPNEPINWQGKNVTVKTYSEAWGAVMKLFKKATLVKVKEEDGQEKEKYVNKRSLGKQMLMAQGIQEADITDKDKDAAYELLFLEKPISKLSQNQIICIPSNLFEQVHAMLAARGELKDHTGKEDEELYKKKHDQIHDTYVSQNKNIVTIHLKNRLKIINELINSGENKFNDLKTTPPGNSQKVFENLLADSLDTLEWEELSPPVEIELEGLTLWLHKLHFQLDTLVKIRQDAEAKPYDFDSDARTLTEFVKKRPKTPWLDMIEFLHLPPGKSQSIDDKTVKCLHEVAKQGNVKAQFKLGQLYEMGVNGVIENSIEKSIEHYQQAAAQGHSASQARLGQLYLAGKYKAKSDQELGSYLEAAVNLDPRAAVELGLMFEKGAYTPKSDLDTLEYLKAALADDKAAILYQPHTTRGRKFLGQMIIKGIYIPSSNRITYPCLESLTNDGNLEAQYRRGLMAPFATGQEFLKLAADRGHLKAQYELGKAFLTRYKIQGDDKKEKKEKKEKIKNQAIHYLSLAAKRNHAESQYLLGTFLCDLNDASTFKSGMSYLQKAASGGHAGALAKLDTLDDKKDHKIDPSS